MDLDFTLYDTAVFGATANAESVLFQLAQGADATHTEAFTNSRGAGQLPQTEQFTCRWIGVRPVHALVEADIEPIWRGSFLEVRIADQTVLKAPLALFAAYAAFGGHFTQAAGANRVMAGLAGTGMELAHDIVIPGGTAYRVRVVQGPAVTAGSNMVVMLRGTLAIP